jgi:uncharacterized protein (DUF1697 family)
MPHYVAFLRGINLGKRRIKMERLAALFVELGFSSVSTFIASGNVLFESKGRDEAKLAAQIEQHLAKSLNYDVDTFVRSRAELSQVAAFRPFPDSDLDDPANTIHVGFTKSKLSANDARKLVACRTEVDAFQVNEREFYWLCRIRSSESTIWASPQLKAIRLPSATMRNLTTIRKLAALEPVLVV